jgi:small subunit ribosomal protein S20
MTLLKAKQNVVSYFRNKSTRTRVKSVIKDVTKEMSQEKAQAALATAIPVIDKAVKKGAIHRRNASRKISRLTRQVNAITQNLGASPQVE